MLFAGSLKENIDPFNNLADDQLLSLVRLAGLGKYDYNLDIEVAEEGGNFSVGEKQLICLARALGRRSRIVVMDEATASMDLETDRMIQETVRREFRESTVIIIAHRLDTVMDCDRVVVMGEGRVLEVGPPGQLALDSGSEFHKMVNLV